MYRLEKLRPAHILYAELVAACWFMLMVCGLYLGVGLTYACCKEQLRKHGSKVMAGPGMPSLCVPLHARYR